MNSGEVRSNNITAGTRQEYLLDLIYTELKQLNEQLENA